MSLLKAGVHRTALGAAVTIALILGVVIGCAGSPGETSGAQGPGSGSKSGSNDFPNSLMEVLTKLVTQDIPGQPNLAVKYLLASDALANLNFKTVGKITAQKLDNEDDFKLTEKSQPTYFGTPFKSHQIVTVNSVKTQGGRYDYATSKGTWVDYAAVNLGGGAFHNGFGQEETMTLEMPELANTVAQGDHWTRSPGCDQKKPKVMLCNPRPLLIGPVHRTISIDAKLSSEWDKPTFQPDTAFGLIHPLSHNVELNVLAIAVSSLEGEKEVEQTAQNTIDDMFNTLVAGFTLAKSHSVTEVNTGGIGTGIFQNSKEVVYVIQKLAASHVGLKTLNYYGVGDKDKTDWDGVVTKVVSKYEAGGTKTVKHLLELARDELK